MPFHESSALRYYSFESLQEAGVAHGVFTRGGGVSPQPWSSLNVGATVGDDLRNVYENRLRAFQAFQRPFESLFDVWQVHGTEVVCAEAPRPADQAHQKADAILTDRPGVTLFMRFADCVPIYLYDPVHKVVGLVHAGWLGTVRQAAAVAIQAMQARYGSRPEEVLAGIGPSIAAHHYEVGSEVIAQVQAAFGAEASGLLLPSNGASMEEHALLDLWAANRLVLERSGVRRIEIAGICTACGLDDWYSHRAEKGQTGRFGGLIAL